MTYVGTRYCNLIQEWLYFSTLAPRATFSKCVYKNEMKVMHRKVCYMAWGFCFNDMIPRAGAILLCALIKLLVDLVPCGNAWATGTVRGSYRLRLCFRRLSTVPSGSIGLNDTQNAIAYHANGLCTENICLNYCHLQAMMIPYDTNANHTIQMVWKNILLINRGHLP